jgi:uncharacterized protein with PQ loop repeat
MDIDISDYIGYSASFFIVMSFIMKDLKKIRIINCIGCLLFVIYGVLKGNGVISAMYWPIIIPNVVICFVQIYHLRKG